MYQAFHCSLVYSVFFRDYVRCINVICCRRISRIFFSKYKRKIDSPNVFKYLTRVSLVSYLNNVCRVSKFPYAYFISMHVNTFIIIFFVCSSFQIIFLPADNISLLMRPLNMHGCSGVVWE